MVSRTKSGQEAVEFVIISILVFFAATGVVFLFGGKLAAFFTQDSSAKKVASAKVNVISKNSTQKYDSGIETSETMLGKTVTIDGVTYMKLPDGSYLANYEGTTYKLPKTMIDRENVAMETLGTDGLKDLVKLITYFAKKHNILPEDVEVYEGDADKNFKVEKCSEPKGIDSWFSDEECNTDDKGGTTSGKADINLIALKYKNQVLIKQKDQKCEGSGCYFNGTFQIEGAIDSNKFNGGISGKFNGTYNNSTVSVIDENKLKFNYADFKLNTNSVKNDNDDDVSDFFGLFNLWGSEEKVTAKPEGTMQMDFTKANYNFKFK